MFTNENNFGLLRTRLMQGAKKVDAFSTEHGGSMYAMGVGGPITGRGADVLLIDDYIKEIKEALSPAQRQYIWDWFTTTARTRLEPGGTVIIVATRWHSDDLIGRICTNMMHQGWDYIEIPAIATQEHCNLEGGLDIFGRHVGDALFPARYPIADLLELQDTLGSIFFSALFQQKPVDQTNKIADRTWIKIATEVTRYNEPLTFARAWDLAATKDGGDFTCGIHFVYNKQRDVGIYTDMQRGQLSAQQAETLVKRTAEEDGIDTKIYIEVEPGSSGKALFEHYRINVLPGYTVIPVPSTKAKVVRAQPMLAAAEAGKLSFLQGPWNEAALREFDSFPGEFDDQ
ncbi:hypothetical protein GP486_008622, partial [Trichoglossum hirsutum]